MVGERVLGRWGRIVISAQVICLEWAFCSAMLLVIGSSVHTIEPSLNAKLVIVLCTPICVVLCCIRFLKDTWVVSMAGVLVYLFGVIGCTFYFGFSDGTTTVTSVDLVSPKYLITMIGTSIYSLEGINLVLPCEGTLRERRHADSIMYAGMAAIVALNSSFGALGYYFGYGACDVVTDCLPEHPLATAVQAALAITLLFTVPVTMFPATELVEELLIPKTTPPAIIVHSSHAAAAAAATAHPHALEEGGSFSAPPADAFNHTDTPHKPTPSTATTPASVSAAAQSPHSSQWERRGCVATLLLSDNAKRFAIRSGEVLITVVFALIVPNLSLFTSLLGSMFVTIMGFVLPPLLYVKHFRPTGLMLVFNYFIIVIGIIFSATGTSISIYAIVMHYVA
eukprot:TRINITY_DN3512_c3_g1_i1.p1 TRINITY_DN3512_c3_g1~~TRINITY_DN3512_c3_g1_i1.p1  ORF type:complete len:395 (-),score=143.20 TRINITY_DN3512_c3_g1_i1:697-1881(-)